MKKFTLLFVITALFTFTVSAQISKGTEGLIGLYDFSNTDDIFFNSAPEAGVGTVQCEGVMKFLPDAPSSSEDDQPSEEGVDWEVIDGINNKAIALHAHNWFKVWHGIPANGGGDYVNDFSVVFDVRVSDAAGIHSLLEVNPTPSENGYTSELEIAELLVGGVGAPLSGEDALGFSEQALTAGEWARVIYVAQLSQGIYIYVNGELWHSMEGDFTDGRPAPYGADTDPEDAAFKLCGNNEGPPANDPPRDGDKDVDMIAVFNRSLSADDVASLGGPGSWASTDELKVSNFTIYPNPANDMISISVTDATQFEIVNIAGQIVERSTINNQTTEYDISNLNSGVYFVNVSLNNGRTITQKLIVK